MTNKQKAENMTKGFLKEGLIKKSRIQELLIKAMDWKDKQREQEKQQMKEVKLTWKDMREIVAISDRMLVQKGNLDDKGFYESVLEQFKTLKGE